MMTLRELAAAHGVNRRTLLSLVRVCDRLGGEYARAAYIGDELWGRGLGKPQRYARPAARLLHKLHGAGLVARNTMSHGVYWSVTEKGTAVAGAVRAAIGAEDSVL